MDNHMKILKKHKQEQAGTECPGTDESALVEIPKKYRKLIKPGHRDRPPYKGNIVCPGWQTYSRFII